METRRSFNTSLLLGVSLVLVGLIFLAATSGLAGLNWSNIWPALVILLGVEPITRAILDPEVNELRRGRLVAEGSFLLMLGGYFFTITLGAFSWSQQATQWPVYLMIIGIAAIIGYLASSFQRTGYLITGLIVTVLGAGLLASTLSGLLYAPRWGWFEELVRQFGPEWETTWWPVFPIVTGLCLLVGSAMASSRGVRVGLALPGTILLLTGGFHLATTLDYITWSDQGKLWPLYLLIVGAACLVAYFASDSLSLEGNPYRWLLIAAMALGGLGAVFLFMTLMGNETAWQLWPLVLIVVGALLLIPWMRGPGQKSLGGK
jgi:hypothetical protein